MLGRYIRRKVLKVANKIGPFSQIRQGVGSPNYTSE